MNMDDDKALIEYIMKYIEPLDLININKELDSDERIKYALNKANKVNKED